MTVFIDSELVDIIRNEAARAYPDECCGLLTGEKQNDDDVVITGVHISTNVTSGNPARSFEIDPKMRFDLMRLVECMDDGTEIIGHYHSHPDHPAKPSATDLSMAHELDFIWIICATSKNGDGDLGVFKPKPDQSAFNQLQCVIK